MPDISLPLFRVQFIRAVKSAGREHQGRLAGQKEPVHRRTAEGREGAKFAISGGNLARQGRPRDDLGGRQGNNAAGKGD